jgi:peptide/nickel transport system permease protein
MAHVTVSTVSEARGFTLPRRLRAWGRRSPLAAAGLSLLGAFVLVAVLAPWIMPYDPVAADAVAVLQEPSAAHVFGTDANGMDVLSRVIFGTIYAFAIALPAVTLAIIVGVPVGLITGYAGGWTDEVLMRFFDALRVFPSIILALAVVSAAGASVLNVVLVLGLLDAPVFARLVRSEVLALRSGSLVECAIATGNPVWRVLLVHLMPNTLQGTLAQAAVRASWAVRLSTTFAFLGLGIQPPTPEWGAMIRQGAEYMVSGQWWIGVFPGIALILLSLGLNMAGDGLADLLDPRRRSAG